MGGFLYDHLASAKHQRLEEDRRLVFDFAQNVRQSGNERRLGNCCLGRLVYL